MAGPLLRLLATLPLFCGLHACTSHTPGQVVGADSFATTSQTVRAALLYPDLASNGASERVYTDDRGGAVVIDRVSPGRDRIVVERLIEESGDPPRETVQSVRTLAVGDDGEVLLLGSINPQRRLEIRYEPPLVVAPAVLRPGEEHSADSAAHEPDPGTGRTVRSGTASFGLELLGERTTGAGVELLVRSTLEIRLGRSVVRRTTDRVYRVGSDGSLTLQLKAETETVTAMGFTVNRSERSLRPGRD